MSEMSPEGVIPRLNFLVPRESSKEFEQMLKNALGEAHDGVGVAQVLRPHVQGQSLDPALTEFIRIVVALGGGVGVATIIDKIGNAMAQFIKARRIRVKFRNQAGTLVSLENLTEDQVKDLLRGARNDGASKK